jgi:hypothetical protein
MVASTICFESTPRTSYSSVNVDAAPPLSTKVPPTLLAAKGKLESGNIGLLQVEGVVFIKGVVIGRLLQAPFCARFYTSSEFFLFLF